MWCRIKTPASPFLSKSFGGNHARQAIQSHLAWCVKGKLARGESESETKWMWCQTSHCVSLSLIVSGFDSTGKIDSETHFHLSSCTAFLSNPTLSQAYWTVQLYTRETYQWYTCCMYEVGQIKNILQNVDVSVSKSTAKRRVHQSKYWRFNTRHKSSYGQRSLCSRLLFHDPEKYGVSFQ